MKIDLMRFAKALYNIGPALVPFIAPQLAPLVPIILHMIEEAEASGQPGPEKKAHVVATVDSVVEAINTAKGGAVIDPENAHNAAEKAVDATIQAINAVHAKAEVADPDATEEERLQAHHAALGARNKRSKSK